MTTTRKYYECLIDYFSELNSIKPNEVVKFLDIKSKINHLIRRIEKFNLFTLTFTDDFFNTLNKETLDDFLKEKLSLSNELYYELNECLSTSRLRYGGELIQYVVKINHALLKLTIQELSFLDTIKKDPEHYYFPYKYIFNTESEKETKKKELTNLLREQKIQKSKVKLTSKEYDKIESVFAKEISFYKDYVYENYPSICNNFQFYNKKVIAYITLAQSSEIYEFRIHSYITNNGDTSSFLERKFYDFYPAYFDNLEEIIDNMFSAYVSILNKKSLEFKSPFYVQSIHKDLIRIFISNAKEEDILKFVEFLLKCDGYHIVPLKNKEYSFDIETEKDGQIILYEIFHHKPRSVKRILEKIQNLKEVSSNRRLKFLFTSSPSQETRNLLQENRIAIVQLNELINKHFSLDNSNILHWYIKSVLPEIIILEETGDSHFIGEGLITKLKECPSGEKDWSNYEKIGVDIFKFLFEDNFKVYLAEEQIENDMRNHRRDLLVHNNYRDSSSFWAEVKQSYNAKAIIIDFKNYREKLKSTTLFNVSKYTKKNVGNFAIIFSRRGIDQTAKNEQYSLFQNSRLVIPFSDDELIDMIKEKIIGKDPIDRLESKYFELVKRS